MAAPPNESVEYQVIQAVIARLATMNGPAGGYFTTVAQVVRNQDWQDDLMEYPAIQVTTLDSDYTNANDGCSTEFSSGLVLTLVLQQHEDRERDVERFIADTIKCLNTSGNPPLGGLVERIEFESGRRWKYTGTQPRAGGELNVTVHHQFLDSDPYTSA